MKIAHKKYNNEREDTPTRCVHGESAKDQTYLKGKCIQYI